MNTEQRTEFSLPSWECIHVVSSASTVEENDPSSRVGVGVYVCDIDGVTDERTLFDKIAGAMKFPSYFGRNWDALDECLSDLEWLPTTGFLLVVRRCGTFWRNSPISVGRLIKTWLFCAQQWAKQDVPFHLVLSLDE